MSSHDGENMKFSSIQKYLQRFTALVICGSLVGLSLTAMPPDKKPKPNPKVQLPLADVVKAVEAALDETAKHPVDGFPKLQSVTIAAQASVTKDVNGNFKLFVVSIGGEKSVQNLSSVTFELKPPTEASQKIVASSVNPEDIQNALARQIEKAKLGFLDLKPASPTALKTDKVEIQIGFDITT